ncbi:arginase family enzyme [Bradyrhizobium japonicum]|nr:arginase family enzyme [Bradyrhizobium japonicum]MCP1962097.1 arginase family enzyme [Bradyrhizobium japonicum]
MASAVGRVQVVQLDAHHDYADRPEGYGPTHSNFVSFLVDDPNVSRVTQVGVRGLSTLLPKQPDKVVESRLQELSTALLPEVPVYLTIDTDAFDPGIAPAVVHPVPGGLRWTDLSAVVESIYAERRRLVGLDWTEYNPTLEGRNAPTGVAIALALGRLLSEMGHYVRAEPTQ